MSSLKMLPEKTQIIMYKNKSTKYLAFGPITPLEHALELYEPRTYTVHVDIHTKTDTIYFSGNNIFVSPEGYESLIDMATKVNGDV